MVYPLLRLLCVLILLLALVVPAPITQADTDAVAKILVRIGSRGIDFAQQMFGSIDLLDLLLARCVPYLLIAELLQNWVPIPSMHRRLPLLFFRPANRSRFPATASVAPNGSERDT